MKINKKLLVVVIALFAVLVPRLLVAQVRLPKLVSDSMIVQRDTKLKIWGWAAKDEKINIRFAGKNYKTITGIDGKWLVSLSPVKAGGPYEMEIKASNTIILKNILAGDVWFCSGQSNMVHALELHKERYADDIAQANNPFIRQFLIPSINNLQGPSDDLPNGSWKSVTPANVMKFSVVAYFFAKKVYEKYHVPIGIINASVGGTPIEAWTSEDGLRGFPEMIATVQKNKDTSYVNTINRTASAQRQTIAKRKQEDKGLIEPTPWYDTTYIPKNWNSINVPGYWEDQGIKDLDGVVWYKKEIDLPTSMTSIPAKIALGRIVDADALYVNGKLIGSTSYQYPQRRYIVPAGILKPGKNSIVVRVLNNGGKGGFVPDKPYYLAAGDQAIDLKGTWQYKVGEVYARDRISPGGIAAQNQPTTLYNAMVAPLLNFQVKGFVWYQGESNAGRAREYVKLLPALIADWRSKWQLGDLPFLYVQLPNYMDVNYSPSESDWALTREAQLKALSVNKAAMTVAIDLGEWNDIHPDNKKPIGERLALAAQRVAYNDNNVVYSGPIYRSHKIDGNKIILSFNHVGGGLISIDGEALSQFAIAGADKKFVWGNAKIENNDVVVWNESIPNPMYVRYAWADNPQGANLYNKEQLPASPFRTGE